MNVGQVRDDRKATVVLALAGDLDFVSLPTWEIISQPRPDIDEGTVC
jgi:hypothetical protein